MKHICSFALVTLVLLLSGCTYFKHDTVALDPVGPPPPADTKGPAGTLVVYTALDKQPNPIGIEGYPIHTDYQILDASGKVIYVVHNSAGTFGELPATIRLPEGAYQVHAHVKGFRKQLTVPVILVANETTTVHLDGDKSWIGSTFNQGNGIVSLPNGQIVGWRAVKTN